MSEEQISQTGPTSAGDSAVEQVSSADPKVSFFDHAEKFFENPNDEVVKNTFQEELKKAKAESLAQADTVKKTEEPAPKAAPHDYSQLKLPEGTKLSESHFKSVLEFAKAANLPAETAKVILERDEKVIAQHLNSVEEEFKVYNENSLKTLEKDWGERFKDNVVKSSKFVDFYEKQMPGLKAEIERMGLSNSTTANKLFLRLYEDLKMDGDKFEFGSGASAPPEDFEQMAKRAFPRSLGAVNNP